jgi:hypothetical protein
MPVAEPTPRLKRTHIAALLVVGVVAGLFLWLGWLYPLLPTTVLGWVAAIGSGLLAIVWSGVRVAVLLWLQKQQHHVLLFKSIGVAVALSLGVGVFAGAYAAREFLSSNFSYFGR